MAYQVYVRSFADGNGDGIGDLAGLRSKLPYLADLGIDAVWLNPCYPSPQVDHGYDVADYCDIEPQYGTLDDFDALVAEAGSFGIKVLMDLVPNHCSDQHRWFQRALAAAPGSTERDWFVFRDGSGVNGEEPPNNWHAWFGGPAWTRTTNADGTPGQWYLHMFTREQPDLNWSSPAVAEAFDEVLRFWFDRGVEGFRVDAVVVVGKTPGIPDQPELPADTPSTERAKLNPHVSYQPTVHALMERWRGVADQYQRAHPGRDLVFVGETYTPDIDTLASYIGPTRFHTSFDFDLLLANWDVRRVHDAIHHGVVSLGERGLPVTWTLNNHDTQRSVTRYGHADAHLESAYTGNNLRHSEAPVDLELGTRRARAMALIMFGVPGALYLYYGEELGLPEVLDLPESALQDPIWERSGHTERGRDGCRVPMPWTADTAHNFGFSSTAASNSMALPWMPQPADYGLYGADREERDPGSMLNLYRHLIRLRTEHLVHAPGSFAWVDAVDPSILAFIHGPMLVAANFGTAAFTMPAALADGRELVAVSSARIQNLTLEPGDAVWLLKR